MLSCQTLMLVSLLVACSPGTSINSETLRHEFDFGRKAAGSFVVDQFAVRLPPDVDAGTDRVLSQAASCQCVSSKVLIRKDDEGFPVLCGDFHWNLREPNSLINPGSASTVEASLTYRIGSEKTSRKVEIGLSCDLIPPFTVERFQAANASDHVQRFTFDRCAMPQKTFQSLQFSCDNDLPTKSRIVDADTVEVSVDTSMINKGGTFHLRSRAGESQYTSIFRVADPPLVIWPSLLMPNSDGESLTFTAFFIAPNTADSQIALNFADPRLQPFMKSYSFEKGEVRIVTDPAIRSVSSDMFVEIDAFILDKRSAAVPRRLKLSIDQPERGVSGDEI